MRVVAEHFVKDGALADGAINENGVAGSIARENVGLDGDEQLAGRFGKGGENRLTPDDDNVAGVGITGRRTNDMFKLRPIHGREISE